MIATDNFLVGVFCQTPLRDMSHSFFNLMLVFMSIANYSKVDNAEQAPHLAQPALIFCEDIPTLFSIAPTRS